MTKHKRTALLAAVLCIAALVVTHAITEAVDNTEPAPTVHITPATTAHTVPMATDEPPATISPTYFDEASDPEFTGYETLHYEYTDSEIDMLAQTVWGEARGCSEDEWRLVVWCIFQRVDNGGFGDSVADVITKPYQFVGYSANNPIDETIYSVCHEEIQAWAHGAEPPTHEEYAPTAPYLFFDGDGKHNYYREEW